MDRMIRIKDQEQVDNLNVALDEFWGQGENVPDIPIKFDDLEPAPRPVEEIRKVWDNGRSQVHRVLEWAFPWLEKEG